MIPIIVSFWGQKQEKLTLLEEHLRENNVPSWSYYFGFNGRGLKIREFKDVTYYGDPEELRGKAIGQHLTHWGLWASLKMASERNQNDSMWTIIEDDFRFKENWSKIYHDVMEDLPGDWDIVLFGNCCTLGLDLEKITDNLYKGGALCLHWYMIKRRALDVLLETNRMVQGRIDVQMLRQSYKHLNAYTVLPSIAGQADTELPL